LFTWQDPRRLGRLHWLKISHHFFIKIHGYPVLEMGFIWGWRALSFLRTLLKDIHCCTILVLSLTPHRD
jgi:hypothetical protein